MCFYFETLNGVIIMNRKKFIINSITTIAGVSISGNTFGYSQGNVDLDYDEKLIKEFVLAGHNNLSKTKELLEEYPNLISSRHHWGNGDFEEAIEGASHVGNKDIAEYLIGKGARINIFTLTMLGKTEIVKSILEQFPNLVYAKGPHGFSLLHHAKAGGKDSEALYYHLTELGLGEMKFKLN